MISEALKINTTLKELDLGGVNIMIIIEENSEYIERKGSRNRR